jgi:hypothetical protein
MKLRSFLAKPIEEILENLQALYTFLFGQTNLSYPLTCNG